MAPALAATHGVPGAVALKTPGPLAREQEDLVNTERSCPLEFMASSPWWLVSGSALGVAKSLHLKAREIGYAGIASKALSGWRPLIHGLRFTECGVRYRNSYGP